MISGYKKIKEDYEIFNLIFHCNFLKVIIFKKINFYKNIIFFYLPDSKLRNYNNYYYKKRGFKDDFIDQTNYESIGGSPIIGVNGNVMIAHGISSPLAIQNMIGWAYKQVKSKAYLHIAQALS